MSKLLNIALIISSFFLFSACNEDIDDIPIEKLNFVGPIESFNDFVFIQLLDHNNLDMLLLIQGQNRQILELNEDAQNFPLPFWGIKVELTKWNMSMKNHYSNEIPNPNAAILDTWSLVEGNISLSASDVNTNPLEAPYKLSILLENAVFENAVGDQKKIDIFSIDDAFSGWIPR